MIDTIETGDNKKELVAINSSPGNTVLAYPSSKGVNIFLSLLQFGSVLAFAFSYITYSPNKASDNIDNPYQNNNLFNELK